MKVLFLCTGNSCRSQMAEGFARHLGGEQVEAYSAGTYPADQVHPLAVRVMEEKGIDISTQRPKRIDEVLDIEYDTVITVCGDAEERCPAFPEDVYREHWPVLDPAKATGTDAEVLATFRGIRDELEGRVRDLLQRRRVLPGP